MGWGPQCESPACGDTLRSNQRKKPFAGKHIITYVLQSNEMCISGVKKLSSTVACGLLFRDVEFLVEYCFEIGIERTLLRRCTFIVPILNDKVSSLCEEGLSDDAKNANYLFL